MVIINPVWIIVAALAAAFFIGLWRRGKESVAGISILVTLGFMSVVSGGWLAYFIGSPAAEPAQVFTAGFSPPLSIMLRMGPEEAFVSLLVNLVGLLGGIYLLDTLRIRGKSTAMVFLVLMAGLNGLVMTGDLFNLFVFLEIAAIAVAGLMTLRDDPDALSSGFKYMIAGGVVTGTLLLGTVFVYHLGGSLSLDHLATVGLPGMRGGIAALFLVVVSLVLELKPFPANGWALDIYSSAEPGVSAVISGAYATAVLFALTRVLPLWGADAYNLVLVMGMVTFVGSNLLGLVQKQDRRLLGYSSVAQIGLLMTVVGLKPQLGEDFAFVAGGLLISHILAKSILFWLSGWVRERNLDGWGVLAGRPFLLVAMGTAVLMLTGFPPFPAFFAKWKLVMRMAADGGMTVVWLLLLGSMLEAVYLFRWLGLVVKGQDTDEKEVSRHHLNRILPLGFFVLSGFGAGIIMANRIQGMQLIFFLPLGLAAVLYLMDFLPAAVKNTIVLAAMGVFSWFLLPQLEGLRLIFGIIFLVGGWITLLAGYAWRGPRRGFYPMAVLMFSGLAVLLTATTTLEFFFGWEIMTAGSYFLILRGKRALRHSFHYMLFSIGGALLMMAGFGLAHAAAAGDIGLTALSTAASMPGATLVFILLATGFLTKTAALPLHIWLPGAHAEAETDVSPMVSAILLKAGVFGMVMLLVSWREALTTASGVALFLSWLGAITALLGNIMAVFQEDAKRLLAYSSIAQLGYIIFGLSFMNHLGWLSAITFSINHLIFKALLFLAIGGVVWRVKTRNMYQMGGLIKKMPISFLSVLIGIITLSGVPPLSGFAGKWLVYNAIIIKGWPLQGVMVIMAGIIAFLYCFRLIHTVFLGMPKDRFRNVREAPFWILVPQVLFMGAIMVFSMVPNMVLRPVGKILNRFFPADALRWEGSRAYTSLGYWDGTMIMYIAGGIFVAVLIWLILMVRRSQKVKAFNIVYAAERPFRPETTHFAHNFFAPFRKALGVLATPLATRFWSSVADSFQSAADFGRRIYSGNGQAYVLHMVLYTLVFYFLWIGGTQ